MDEINLLKKIQDNLQKIGKANWIITQFIMELEALNDSRIKALMEKYQIEIVLKR